LFFLFFVYFVFWMVLFVFCVTKQNEMINTDPPDRWGITQTFAIGKHLECIIWKIFQNMKRKQAPFTSIHLAQKDHNIIRLVWDRYK
jgi:hypothetical protein